MREIVIEVRGQFIYKSSKLGGVQGEGNASRMRIRLDDSWSGYSKRIVWRDARGLCPTAVLLGADQMTGENTPLDYTVSIPPEPLAVAGWCSFTIEGYTQQDDGTAAVALTAEDRLEVLAGGYGQPAEPTVSQALQLQREIDTLLGDMSAQAADAKAAAARASEASTLAQDAFTGAEEAMIAAAEASNLSNAAKKEAQTAANNALLDANLSRAAVSKAEAAQTAAETARDAAQTAARSIRISMDDLTAGVSPLTTGTLYIVYQ